MDDIDKEIAQLEQRLAVLRLKKQGTAAPNAATSGKKPAPAGVKAVWTIGSVFAIGVLMVTCSAPKPPRAPASAPDASVAASTQSVAAPPAEAPQQAVIEQTAPSPKWDYSEHSDAMSDTPTVFACVESSNQVIQSAPYDNVTGRLCLRRSPKFGLDVFVALNGEGQILCRSYEDCIVRVRFDDKPVQSFSAVGAADGSSNMFFLRNTTRFIAATKAADVTHIEFSLYRNGDQYLSFPTEGLEWPPKKTD